MCAFYNDHALFDDYTGVVLDLEEGKRIAHALGDAKAVILRNHGLLTAAGSVEAAVWWFVTMERSCQAQLLAMSAGEPVHIDDDCATLTHSQVGSEWAGRLVSSPCSTRSWPLSPTCSTDQRPRSLGSKTEIPRTASAVAAMTTIVQNHIAIERIL